MTMLENFVWWLFGYAAGIATIIIVLSVKRDLLVWLIAREMKKKQKEKAAEDLEKA